MPLRIHLPGLDKPLFFEHSLLSISKWESLFGRPFNDEKDKTDEEAREYLSMMALEDYPDSVYSQIRQEDLSALSTYIASSQTATWFTEDKSKAKPGDPKKKLVVTSEIIYYWMISHQIPFECEKWHLNRLLTLIRVCDEKAKEAERKQKGGKAPAAPRSSYAQRQALNRQRREQHNTSG